MQVYIGIDWSENKHDMAILNEAGAIIAQKTVPHTQDGFLQLDRTRVRLSVSASDCLVGLETSHNLLIDFLWACGYSQVYVIPPSVVKSKRSGYSQSGGRTDQSDAILLADVLRRDRRSLQPWRPDSLLTRQLRARVSFVGYLTRGIVAQSNRLRSVLLRYHPAALGLFSSLTAQIALEFICAYPTPQAAAALTFAQFKTFARQHRYRRPSQLPARFAHLQADQPLASPDTVSVYQDEAQLLATRLLQDVRVKTTLLRELHALFQRHPDCSVFNSLPGAGQFLAPALLAKFGDDRKRFPTPGSVQALAGTCPVTDESGKRRRIKFRRACDREFRNIAQQWALCSRSYSIWANAYWQQVRPRCRSDSHAYRCLANRWLAIAWKLWQTRQPYDEDYHLRQRALRSKPSR
jgi:transposase